jgi:hypothetical protein
MDYGIHLVFAPEQLDSRCQLVLEVTFDTLCSDPQLRLCEGLRLIEAARSSVARLSPDSLEMLERRVVPAMRQALMQRFGVTDAEPMLEVN